MGNRRLAMKPFDEMREEDHVQAATETLHAITKAEEIKGSANEAYRGMICKLGEHSKPSIATDRRIVVIPAGGRKFRAYKLYTRGCKLLKKIAIKYQSHPLVAPQVWKKFAILQGNIAAVSLGISHGLCFQASTPSPSCPCAHCNDADIILCILSLSCSHVW